MNELCKTIDAYLVELDSRDEQKFVSAFLRAHSKSFAIIGANDVEREGIFVHYNSKKPIPALRWYRTQPDNWRNEDCVRMWPYGLNDVTCRLSGAYM
ncbi:Cd209 antigen, partial [Plakobranchus ocellatus]